MASDEELYDLASQPQPAKPTPAAAQVSPVRPKVLRYQDAPTDKAGFDPERLKNLHAPLALFAGGLLVQAGIAFWQTSLRSLPDTYLWTGVELAISTCLMLIVFRWCAHHRGFAFGKFADAVLKVMAVSVAPSSAIFLMGVLLWFLPLGLGYLLSWVLGFCFYFALIGYFFDLDQDDTWYCVIALFLTRLAVAIVAVVALR